MEESQEIKDLVYEAGNSDVQGNFGFWEQHISKNPNVMVYGSGPGAKYMELPAIKGYKNIITQLREELNDMKPSSFEINEIQAFSEGSVGWYFLRATGVYPNGIELSFRISGVLHKEDGSWKLVMQNTLFQVPDKK